MSTKPTAQTVALVLQELFSYGQQLSQSPLLDRSLDGREDGGADEQEEHVERRQKYQTHVALLQRHRRDCSLGNSISII